MKLIIAYIQPHKLNDVKKALFSADVHKMSVTNALGCGEQLGYEESYRGIKFEAQGKRVVEPSGIEPPTGRVPGSHGVRGSPGRPGFHRQQKDLRVPEVRWRPRRSGPKSSRCSPGRPAPGRAVVGPPWLPEPPCRRCDRVRARASE